MWWSCIVAAVWLFSVHSEIDSDTNADGFRMWPHHACGCVAGCVWTVDERQNVCWNPNRCISQFGLVFGKCDVDKWSVNEMEKKREKCMFYVLCRLAVYRTRTKCRSGIFPQIFKSINVQHNRKRFRELFGFFQLNWALRFDVSVTWSAKR